MNSTPEILPPSAAPEIIPVSPHSDIKQQRKQSVRFTDSVKQTFLDKLEEVGDRNLAAKLSNISSKTVLVHIQKDPVFRDLVEEALGTFRANLEQLATQRGRNSDRIFELQLKRHIPEYSERIRIEQTTTHVMFNGNLFPLKKMDQRQLAALAVVLGDKAPEEAIQAATAQPQQSLLSIEALNEEQLDQLEGIMETIRRYDLAKERGEALPALLAQKQPQQSDLLPQTVTSNADAEE